MRTLRLALLLSAMAAPVALAQTVAAGSSTSGGSSPAGVPSTTPGTTASSAAYAINPDGTWINGAQGDAAWSGTGNGSLTAISKAMWALLNTGIKVTPQGTTSIVATGVTTTQTSGTTSGTAGTFTSALAASGTRKGCLVQNTSAGVEYVFLGAVASATTASAFQIAAGGSFSCASPSGTIAQDVIAIAAAGASAAYVLAAQ